MRRRLDVYRRYARARLRQRGGLAGPVLTLVTGAAAAQAFVFAARPVLTRLFTPDEFGVLTVFVTLVTVLGTVSSGRYEDALMLPEEDEEAVGLLALALALTTGVALLTALVLLGLPLWTDLLGGPAMRPAFLLLPPAVALAGWSLALETWHTRRHRFRPVSASRALQSGSVVAIQLAAGIAAVGAAGLVAGAVAGFAVSVLWLGVTFLAAEGERLRVRLGALPALARRYARFPLFSAPAALLNVLASRAPVLLLAAFFTPGTVGQFGIAFGTLVLPLGLLTGAVGQVFFVQAAEAHRVGRLGPLTLGVFPQVGTRRQCLHQPIVSTKMGEQVDLLAEGLVIAIVIDKAQRPKPQRTVELPKLCGKACGAAEDFLATFGWLQLGSCLEHLEQLLFSTRFRE